MSDPDAPETDAPQDRRRYPLLLDLTDRDVLVVGGGPVAARRVGGLLAAGARVQVIAPQVCQELADLVASRRIVWVPREAAPHDVMTGPASRLSELVASPSLEQRRDHEFRRRPDSPTAVGDGGGGQRWWLVHTATGVPAVDRAIADAAESRGVWCVRADRAVDSPGHVPAVAQGPDGVQIAVSGGGHPGRARAIRDAISDLLVAGRLPLRRTRVNPAPSGTRGETVPLAPASPRVPRVGDPSRTVDAQVSGRTGRVVLVGGGPGDPGLLTVTGRQWLARADVVVTDRLGPTAVLAELDPDVEIIDVGKVAGHHPIPQDEINRILVEQAQLGRVVVRLKGGDPFVLGRGGEEALHCLAAGVPVEVVPGVTSAVSVAAAAGIPVTHRGITTSFVVASAHAGAGSAQRAAQSAPDDATLVLLMGLSAVATTAAELIDAGRAPDAPVAVVSRGSTPEQRTVVGTLATIAAEVAAAELPGPAIVVVGEVVRLREQLRALDRSRR